LLPDFSMPDLPITILCVVNFKANTGYAWDFIESLYARIAEHLIRHEVRTLVAYPEMTATPRTLRGSTAQPVELDASFTTPDSIASTLAFIRRENVHMLYLADRPAWSWTYVRLRRAGVRWIIVHDHTSGERNRPRGLKRLIKWLVVRIPGVAADVIVAVSDYVARRQVDIGLIPPARVVRLWHGLSVPEPNQAASVNVRALFGIAPGRPLVMCACRAVPPKGVAHLLRAFDRVAQATADPGNHPVLLYLGDGPQLEELKALRDTLLSCDDIILAGYRSDARDILHCADVCVVPSVWQEAFCLSVLEAMVLGKPIVATTVGAIPELIKNDVHGLLVPPADEPALAQAIQGLLTDRSRAQRLAEAARQHAMQQFTPEKQVLELRVCRLGDVGV